MENFLRHLLKSLEMMCHQRCKVDQDAPVAVINTFSNKVLSEKILHGEWHTTRESNPQYLNPQMSSEVQSQPIEVTGNDDGPAIIVFNNTFWEKSSPMKSKQGEFLHRPPIEAT
jgi:hypothetical protein